MSLTADIGRRIELISMDPHFHGISIGLYRRLLGEGPVFLVHTYSRVEGSRRRIAFVADAMRTLGGMVSNEDKPHLLRFPCWAGHELACRRVFLEACKADPNRAVEARPLSISDRKSGKTVTARHLADGVYRLLADEEAREADGRLGAIAGGLIKLGGLVPVAEHTERVAFSCRHVHDQLIGLLLPRAVNVRAVLREEEAAASRGVLAPPSARQ